MVQADSYAGCGSRYWPKAMPRLGSCLYFLTRPVFSLNCYHHPAVLSGLLKIEAKREEKRRELGRGSLFDTGQ